MQITPSKLLIFRKSGVIIPWNAPEKPNKKAQSNKNCLIEYLDDFNTVFFEYKIQSKEK